MDAAWSSSRQRIDGVALHVVEAGPPDGPLLVLLHGFPEFWWGWRRQIGPLAARGFRVVVPDQRGYNRSDKPSGLAAYGLDTLAGDVVGLADRHGRERVHLVGHDWGAVVAWWTAVRHPDRVGRLVVANGPHPDVWGAVARHRPSQLLRSAYVGLFQLPRLPEALLAARGFALARRSLTATSRPGTFSAAALDRYAEAWAQPGALTAMLAYYRALRHRPADRGARVRVPTRVIWGAQDAFLDRELAHAGAALCDEADVVVLEEAGHWVHLEEPDLFTRAVADFVGAGPQGSSR